MNRARLPFAVAVASVVFALAGACSSSAKLSGEGGECELATDCQDGLVCIPSKSGGRVCSADLTSIEKPAGGGGADAGGTPSGDASGGTDASSTKDAAPQKDAAPADTGAPDASKPETGAPDTGAPDTGAPEAGPTDAGDG